MADYMIIASGTSSRHIQSLSEQVLEKLKDNGIKNSKIEGKDSNEWKLVDGIDLIVHIFHPEKRKFYELEKMWSELIPKEKINIYEKKNFFKNFFFFFLFFLLKLLIHQKMIFIKKLIYLVKFLKK